MPPVILVLLQGLFLLLLYVFVARAVRAILRDIATAPAAPRPGSRARRPPARIPAATPGRPQTPPRELVVHRAQGTPELIPLRGDELRIGRAADCQVRLDDGYVSEQHARVYRSDGDWVVADLGSTNGTFLNQSKVAAPAPLAPGDQLAIGKTVIEVRR